MLKNIKIFLSLIVLSFTLTSCFGPIRTPEYNIKDLEERKVGAVISGCKSKYNTHPMFFMPEKIEEKYCSTSWYNIGDYKQDPKTYANDSIDFKGYYNINFVKPGTYRLIGFSGDMDDSYYFSWRGKKGKDPLFFTDFNVTAGEVIYIGNFLIDRTKTKLILHSIEPVYYKTEPWQFKSYDVLKNKVKNRYVKRTNLASFAKKNIPILETE